MPDLPRYTFSMERFMRYRGLPADASVPEQCVSCHLGLRRVEYAMGICTACQNEGKSPGQIVSEAYQRDAWNAVLARHGVPPKYRGCTTETWRGLWPLPGARWRGDPWCIYLWGETGVGKTHVATAIFQHWLREEPRGIAWTLVVEMLKTLREAHADLGEAIAAYIEPKLLVFDELKLADMTPWAREQVSYVIGRRYNETRALIVTSNHGPADLQEFDPTVISRLSEGIVLELTGADWRAEHKGGQGGR
jgi:hypothetical protein